MNWEAIASIAEVVGAIGVIITLVYLAHQIRQNTKQTLLSSLQAINASTNSAFDPVYIPENTRIWTAGLANPGSLDAEQQQVFNLLMARLIASFDSATFQYEHGTVPASVYDGYAAFFSAFVATPGGAEWYLRNRDFWAAATRDRLDRAAARAEDAGRT